MACRRMRSAAAPRALAALTAVCARVRAAVPSLNPAGFFIARHEGPVHKAGPARARPAARRYQPVSGGTSDGSAAAAVRADPGHSGTDLAGQLPGRRGEDPPRRRRNAAVPRAPVQRHADAIGLSVTVMLWHFPIAPRAGALRERRFHGYCPGLIALRARAPRERQIHAYYMELRTSTSFTRHHSGEEEELCVWPGPENVVAYPARS